jgi:hypothetical protein
MRPWLVPAVLLLACGSSTGHPAASPLAEGTISGHVMSGPSCPVVRPGQVCADRPLADVAVEFATDGSRVYTARTDAGGAYQVSLPEAVYRARVLVPRPVVKGPAEVAVRAGASITADYTVDSGIR